MKSLCCTPKTNIVNCTLINKKSKCSLPLPSILFYFTLLFLSEGDKKRELTTNMRVEICLGKAIIMNVIDLF